MSNKLHTALTNIMAMPYFKNEHARSGVTVHGHEDAVALKLADAGFDEDSKTSYPKLSKSLLAKWAKDGDETQLRKATAGMKPGSFIKQPAGSQGFPDVLVLDYDNKFVAFECKSSKGSACPMWNDSLPKPNAIYIMNSGKYNATTVFLGRDVISPAEQKLMDEQEKAIEKIVNEYKKKLSSIDIFSRGWQQKSRRQHFQYGGGTKTDYFKHPDRLKCEQNALNYVK